MTQADIARKQARPIRIFSTVAVLALVSGCQGFPGADATRTDASAGLSNAQLIERDIEAPEIFSTEDLALWDGRPSLGGVWVAATDVRQPERVVIRNPATGKQVVGALFKKEHPDDGLALMLSSDAAIALGVPAGQPTDISVIALREREEEDLPVAANAPFDVEGTTSAEGYLDAPGGDDTDLASETASAPDIGTSVLGTETADDIAAGPLPDPAPVATAAATVTAATGDAALDAGSSGGGLLARISAAVDAANTAESAAPETRTADATAPEVTETPAPLPEREVAASAETDDVPIPALPEAVPSIEAQIAAAILATNQAEEAAREAGRYVPVGQQPASPASVTTTTLGASNGLGPATGKATSRDYVLIGSFGSEAAAKSAAQRFTAKGITTEIRGGGNSWRVVIGPIQTVDQQSAALRNARELGFDDAYPVGG